MSQSESELYILVYPVTEERLYIILSDKNTSFNLFTWVLSEVKKGGNSKVPPTKMSELHSIIYELLEKKKYIKLTLTKNGMDYRPTVKWEWHRMVTHKTLTFWAIVIGTIIGILAIVIPIIATQPSTQPDTKEKNLQQKLDKQLPKPLPDTSHTKLKVLPNDTSNKLKK